MTTSPTSHTAPGRHGKNQAIESLRALAIGLTVLHHLWVLFVWGDPRYKALFDYMTFWGGVDLFFCISGFVITLSVIEQLPSVPPPSGERARVFATLAIPFWIRRAWRLWPTAALWVAIPTLCSLFFNEAGAFAPIKEMIRGGLAALLHVANFHWSDCHNQIGQCALWFPQLSAYWSLSLEEQFYLLFPIVALSLGTRRLPWLLLALILAQAAWTRPVWSPGWAFRTEAIAIGVLIALFTRSPLHQLIQPSFSNVWQKRAVMLGLCLLLVTVPAEPAIVRFNTTLLAMVCGVMVWLASYETSAASNRNGPAARIMFWAASRSYSLYLAHMTVFGITREIWLRLSPPGTIFDSHYTVRFGLTALVLTVVAVELSYRLVETPARRHGIQIAKNMADRLKAQPKSHA